AVDLLLELAVLGFGDRLAQDHGAERVALLVTHGQCLGLERELAILGLELELARLARGALQPARIGAGEQTAAGLADEGPRLRAEQLLEAAVVVDDPALAIERDDGLFER